MLIAVEGIDGAGKSTVRGFLTQYFEDENVLTTREPYDDEWLGQRVRDNIADDETHPLAVFFIFMADHVYHYASIVEPALSEGNIVISDRYIDSRYAYQGYAIDEFVEGDTLEYIQEVQETQWNINSEDENVQTILEDAREAIPEYVLEDLPVIGQYFYGLALNVELLPVFDDVLLSNPESDLVGLSGDQGQGTTWTQLPDRTLLIDVSISTAFERQGEEKDRFEKRSFLEEVRSNYLELADRDADRFIVVDGEQSKSEVRESVLEHIAEVKE